jgi:photosystem II oxygen-evolving enhancer protein 1
MRYRVAIVAFMAICLTFLTACAGGPSLSTDGFTVEELQSLTYSDLVNTGLAGKCPLAVGTETDTISIDPGKSYAIAGLCLEPSEFFVKVASTSKRGEATYAPAIPLTRVTSTLDQIKGSLSVTDEGALLFQEEDGIDFAAITVRLNDGEQFPLLFSLKNLVAGALDPSLDVSSSTVLAGEYKVPSYRTSNFLDPKGRGLQAGYDNAVALPSKADSEEIAGENLKKFDVDQGYIELAISKVNSRTGEIGGVFEAFQPSDTDMGTKESTPVELRGTFFGRVEEAI